MIYLFESYKLDTESREFIDLSDDCRVEMRPKVYELLVYLIENRDRTISKQELFDEIWSNVFGGDATLNTSVKAVRQAVGDNGYEQKVIQTKHSQGYRFVAQVTEQGTAQKTSPANDKFRSKIKPLVYLGLIMVAILFIGYLLSGVFSTQPKLNIANSVAVMPFVDMSEAADQAYFGNGIAEEILNKLGAVEGLELVSRSTSFSVREENLSIPELANRLNVNYIVEGSVRNAGDNIRVTVQLIDVANDNSLWSDSYDRELNDIFAIQDEISLEIASALRVELIGDNIGEVPTLNMEAYALVLQARQMLDIPNFRRSLDARALASRATELDPTYAEAWAVLASSYVYSIAFGVGDQFNNADIQQMFDQGLDAANNAIDLKPDTVRGWNSKGYIYMEDFQWMEAKIALEQAVELDPNHDVSWNFLAIYYKNVGAFEEAVEALNRAIEIYPNNATSISILGQSLMVTGDFDQSHERLEKAIAMDFGLANYNRGLLSLIERNKPAALEDFNIATQYIGSEDREKITLFVDAYFDPSLREDYKKHLPDLSQSTGGSFSMVGPITLGGVLLLDGEYLVEAIKSRRGNRSNILSFLFLPPFREMLNQQVVKDYLGEIGLVNHWRSTSWPPFCRPLSDVDFVCD